MALSHLTAAKESAEQRLAAVMAELAALDASKAGGLPDSPNGIKHQAYKDGLLKEADTLREQIKGLAELITENDEDGAVWEVVSEAE